MQVDSVGFGVVYFAKGFVIILKLLDIVLLLLLLLLVLILLGFVVNFKWFELALMVEGMVVWKD